MNSKDNFISQEMQEIALINSRMQIDLINRQRQEAKAKLASLLQEGLDSESVRVTPTYWQDLRLSVLGTE
jgi:hypothetical protein